MDTSPQRRPKKSGPKPRGLVHQIHIMVTEDLKAWIEAQPEGASAFLRGLAEAARQRTAQPEDPRTFCPDVVDAALARHEVKVP